MLNCGRRIFIYLFIFFFFSIRNDGVVQLGNRTLTFRFEFNCWFAYFVRLDCDAIIEPIRLEFFLLSRAFNESFYICDTDAILCVFFNQKTVQSLHDSAIERFEREEIYPENWPINIGNEC